MTLPFDSWIQPTLNTGNPHSCNRRNEREWRQQQRSRTSWTTERFSSRWSTLAIPTLGSCTFFLSLLFMATWSSIDPWHAWWWGMMSITNTRNQWYSWCSLQRHNNPHDTWQLGFRQPPARFSRCKRLGNRTCMMRITIMQITVKRKLGYVNHVAVTVDSLVWIDTGNSLTVNSHQWSQYVEDRLKN